MPSWHVKSDPHIVTRLKRVFTKALASTPGEVVLADTLENSRELHWFGIRYPFDGKPEDLSRLERRAKEHADREVRVRAILSDNIVSPGVVQMALEPRKYQRVAAALAAETGRLLLADEVGLGKTCTSIAALCQSGHFPALVVTLTHLPRQWKAEFEKFAPSLRVHILHKGRPGDKRDAFGEDLFGMPDVIICNYHKLDGWYDYLGKFIKAVVFDEVQELRRSNTSRYAAARGIADKATLRLGLSATPIYNYGGEIHNVVSILDHECLGEKHEFQREWCTYVSKDDKVRIKDPKAFGAYLREIGVMLRRTRRDVGRELPGVQTIPHYIPTDESVLAQMTGSAAELARKIITSSSVDHKERWRASGEFDNAMRQATGLAKAPHVATFVKMLVENGEKVVLFGWHKAVYDLWKHQLRDLNPRFYTGSETASQKATAIRDFTDGTSQVLIISLRAGAGLDGLQHVCKTVVFGELDWSPGVHEQCLGRVYRDGQPDPVVAYYLLADSGADPIMSDVLGVKKGQIEGLRDPDAPLVEAGVDPNHIKRLAEDFLRRRGELEVA
jgi:SNF2 family DNA or RNA helicase